MAKTKAQALSVKTKDIDYKNYNLLKEFLSDRAKILPRKYSGLSAKQQRKLSAEVKRARFLGLLPFKAKIS